MPGSVATMKASAGIRLHELEERGRRADELRQREERLFTFRMRTY